MKIKYKVLNKDFTSPFQGFQYELYETYYCQDFDNDPNICCSQGFYATDIEGLIYSYNVEKIIVECKCSGQYLEIDQFKQRYEYIKALRIVSPEEIKMIIRKEGLVDSLGYDIEKALFPFNPWSRERKRVTSKEKELLKIWASVRASVWDSVRDSVRASVGASVRASVWDSVWDSVGDSVRASVWASVWDSVRDSVRASVWASVRASVEASVRASVRAYISSLFPSIKTWRYTENVKSHYTNPSTPTILLWNNGLVPSFDGKTWRLHNNNKILHEWKPCQEEKKEDQR
jgi:hypothetical protein